VVLRKEEKRSGHEFDHLYFGNGGFEVVMRKEKEEGARGVFIPLLRHSLANGKVIGLKS
jgi:hypothetical protein